MKEADGIVVAERKEVRGVRCGIMMQLMWGADNVMKILTAIFSGAIETNVTVNVVVEDSDIFAIQIFVNVRIVLIEHCWVPGFIGTKNSVMKIEKFVVRRRTEW